MNLEELKRCLENALKEVVPPDCGCITATGDEKRRYVSCNRMGRRGRPKMVYKLENNANGVQLSFLISSQNPRVAQLKALFEQKRIGVDARFRRDDFYISSGTIDASDVAVMVRQYYESYETNLMRIRS